MATYNIYSNSTGIADWEAVFDPSAHFSGAGTYTQVTLENADGTFTVLNASAGDPIVVDEAGNTVSGTVLSMQHVDATQTVIHAEITGLSLDIYDLAVAATFDFLSDALADAHPTWIDTIPANTTPADWTSHSSTQIVIENIDGTFSYINGSGFTYQNGTSKPIGGTVTSIELWSNSSGTGSAMASVGGLNHILKDLIDYIQNPGIHLLATALASVDSINSADADDDTHIRGGDGNDTINGHSSGGNEFLFGNDGDDTINGNDGLTSYFGGDGSDTFNGSSAYSSTDFDDIRYDEDILSGGYLAVTVNFLSGEAIDGFGETDYFSEIDGARGTEFDDTFIGGTGYNRFQGLDGADSYDGSNGSDDEIDFLEDAAYGGTIRVGVNLSSTNYAGEFGTLAANRAYDGFVNQEALIEIEHVRASDKNDLIIGSASDNHIRAEDGDDLIIGSAGSDIVNGGDGIDGLAYERDTLGVTIDLATGIATGAGIGTDTLIDLEGAIGGSGDDILIGNSEFNILWGKGGNDLIYWTTGDVADGGDGDDTFIITSGSAPTSFDLVGNNFESARAEYTDTEEVESWQTHVIDFDTSWNEVQENYLYDDLTSRRIDYDVENIKSWTSIRYDRQADNDLEIKYTVNDVGTSVKTYFDPDNTANWTRIVDNFTLEGDRYRRETDRDDGTTIVQTLDYNNSKSWDNIQDYFNTSDVRYLRQKFEDDGSYIKTSYDADDSKIWITQVDNFTSNDELFRRVTDRDDGTSIIQTLDYDSSKDWDNIQDYFNSEDDRYLRQKFEDDGSYDKFTYDVDDSKVWSEFQDYFSSTGEKELRLMLYDDLTDRKTQYDWENNKAWETLITDYDVNDEVTDRRYNWDDNSYRTHEYDVAGVETWDEHIVHYDTAGNFVSEEFI